jgi:MFS transporter, AAHS family, 4-hydroxybenzoate transporter
VNLNVSEIVGRSKLRVFQIGIFSLCGLCLIMDGFDLQSIGYVAPAIIQEWNIPSARLGPVFGAGLLGVLIGSLFFSMVADKIGRRPVLISVTFCFSLMTFLAARASSVNELLVIRLLAGLALGGIMPNAVALVGEYSPHGLRVAVMMIVANGFTAGAAFGGFVSAWLIPAYGWRSVFYFGAAVPFVIALVMFLWLPESLQFLAARGKHATKLRRWLKRVDPTLSSLETAVFVAETPRKTGVPIVHLFYDGRATGTIMLWTLNFMNLLELYFLSNWLPTVVKQSGYSTPTAVLVGTTLQVGGMLGGIGLGWLINRLGFVSVLTTSFALAFLNIALIGVPGLSLTLLVVVVFVAGVGVAGGQSGVNALSATYYPTDLRSTGIGAGLGIGRIGAILGPVAAGALISLQWPPERLFIVFAIPALIASAVMFSMHWILRVQPVSVEEMS